MKFKLKCLYCTFKIYRDISFLYLNKLKSKFICRRNKYILKNSVAFRCKQIFKNVIPYWKTLVSKIKKRYMKNCCVFQMKKKYLGIIINRNE